MVAHGLFSIFSTTPDRSFSDVIKYNISKIGLDRFEFFKKFRLGLANIYLSKIYYFEFAYISISNPGFFFGRRISIITMDSKFFFVLKKVFLIFFF